MQYDEEGTKRNEGDTIALLLELDKFDIINSIGSYNGSSLSALGFID